jgi:hypothetical protein
LETSTSNSRRRSTRIPLTIPVRVVGLDPANSFREQCDTVIVNAHGCGVVLGQQLKIGMPVMVSLVTDRPVNGTEFVAAQFHDDFSFARVEPVESGWED